MKITVIYPQSDATQAELARRVAAVHAEHIMQNIRRLSCSADQKQRLLDATIRRIEKKERRV